MTAQSPIILARRDVTASDYDALTHEASRLIARLPSSEQILAMCKLQEKLRDLSQAERAQELAAWLAKAGYGREAE